MRFFISSNIKHNRALYITVVLFLLSSLIFWLLSWIHYHLKFGLTYSRMFSYFFTDPRFPEKLPIGQLLEDIHIHFFLQTLFLLVVASIFIHKCMRDRVKYFLIASSFLAATLEVLFSLGVFYLSPIFIYLKILSFLLFQAFSGAMILLALKLYLSGEKEEPPDRSLLYVIVFAFCTSAILFTGLNFFLFLAKMGLSPSSIATYYVGSSESFIRAKSLLGILNVMNPHLVAMGVYLFGLVHFAFFTNIKRKVLLSVITLLSALTDNLSPLLIRFLDPSFSYLKLISFLSLSLSMLLISLIVMVSILRHRAKAIVLL